MNNYEEPCEQYKETKYCSYPHCENYLHCVIAKFKEFKEAG